MLATVWRMLRNSHDAEDALHTALAVLWEQWALVERHANPHAMILKICADAAIDHLRRRQVRARHEQIDRAFDAAFDRAVELVPSRQRLPPDEAIGHETMDQIMAAIARLPDHQSVAVAMRFVQGASYARIAAALGCSEATVGTHIARGREKLGELLRHLDPNPIQE